MGDHTEFKSGYVSIIGRPNVGKSTLMNRIIGQKIAATSSKPQTTRGRIQTVLTEARGQIIFLDTPGVNRARNKLGEYMLEEALRTIPDADVIVWIVEPADFIGAGERYIIEELKNAAVNPVILAINKIDTKKGAEGKENLLCSIETYRKVFDFAEIVPISAKTGDNVDTLINQIFKYLPEGPKYFDEDDFTDQTEREIAAEIIREKALRCLSDEVPHGIAVVVEKYHERRAGGHNRMCHALQKSGENKKNNQAHALNLTSVNIIPNESALDSNNGSGVSCQYQNNNHSTARKEVRKIIDIEATIICEKDSHKGIIIGKGGAMLKKIGAAARRDIEDMAGEQVNLKLFVKVRKDWRENEALLKSLGYEARK